MLPPCAARSPGPALAGLFFEWRFPIREQGSLVGNLCQTAKIELVSPPFSSFDPSMPLPDFHPVVERWWSMRFAQEDGSVLPPTQAQLDGWREIRRGADTLKGAAAPERRDVRAREETFGKDRPGTSI